MTTNATAVFWIAQALAGGLLCLCIYRNCTLACFGGEEAGGAELTRGERAVIATFYGMTVAGAVNGVGGGAGLLLLGGRSHHLTSRSLGAGCGQLCWPSPCTPDPSPRGLVSQWPPATHPPCGRWPPHTGRQARPIPTPRPAPRIPRSALIMPRSSTRRPTLTSKNTGNQTATRHNRPLGMSPAR